MDANQNPRVSLKERQWSLREDTILDAASELVGTKGYNAMTMDDVSQLVGISKATLYQHFSSKHDLVVSVASRTEDQAYERMASIDQTLPPNVKLSRLIESIVEIRFGQDKPTSFEAIGDLISILSSEHPFLEKERRNFMFLYNMVDEVQKSGGLIPGIAVVVAVHVIMGAAGSQELERCIKDGRTSKQEIANSIKHMLLKEPV